MFRFAGSFSEPILLDLLVSVVVEALNRGRVFEMKNASSPSEFLPFVQGGDEEVDLISTSVKG